MKPIRNLFDKLKPMAEKNNFAHAVYDGLETFFFQPNHITKQGVHIRDGIDLKRTMFHVVIALQLCLLHGTLNIGHWHYAALGMYPGLMEGLVPKMVYGLLQLLPIILVVHIVGLGIEFIFAAIKRHGIEEGFLVSGVLIPLVMPPDIPLWMVATATAFSVVIAKEAFGGTGMNILNVALTARVFVFFAFPTAISGDAVWVSYDYNILHQIVAPIVHATNDVAIVDGFSGATPMALAVTGGVEAINEQFSFMDIFLGVIPGSIGESSVPAILFGLLVLIFTGIASWRVMLSMLLGGVVMTLLFNAFAVNPFMEVPVHYQLCMGGFMFGFVYMATDPVTAAQTNTGKWIYGFLIGFIAILIRVLNPAYPEGVMLAILLLNVFAPLIDHYVIEANIKRRLARA